MHQSINQFKKNHFCSLYINRKATFAISAFRTAIPAAWATLAFTFARVCVQSNASWVPSMNNSIENHSWPIKLMPTTCTDSSTFDRCATSRHVEAIFKSRWFSCPGFLSSICFMKLCRELLGPFSSKGTTFWNAPVEISTTGPPLCPEHTSSSSWRRAFRRPSPIAVKRPTILPPAAARWRPLWTHFKRQPNRLWPIHCRKTSARPRRMSWFRPFTHWTFTKAFCPSSRTFNSCGNWSSRVNRWSSWRPRRMLAVKSSKVWSPSSAHSNTLAIIDHFSPYMTRSSRSTPAKNNLRTFSPNSFRSKWLWLMFFYSQFKTTCDIRSDKSILCQNVSALASHHSHWRLLTCR